MCECVHVCSSEAVTFSIAVFCLRLWPFSVPMIVVDLDLHQDALCSMLSIRPESR